MVEHEAGFFALDRHTGAPRWHYPLARPGTAGHWGTGASAAVDETKVFVAGLDGQVRAFRQDL
jgi:outer membrane protein assembly factor BamB